MYISVTNKTCSGCPPKISSGRSPFPSDHRFRVAERARLTYRHHLEYRTDPAIVAKSNASRGGSSNCPSDQNYAPNVMTCYHSMNFT